MKKSFMTRVLAVSLSAAMTLSLSTVSNLQTASAAAKYVQLQTTYKTLQKVGDKATIKLRNYSAKGWKIKTATSSDKSIVKAYLFKNPKNAAPYVKIKAKGLGRARVTVTAYHKPTKKKTVYKKMKLTVQVGPKAGADTPTPGTSAQVAYDVNSVTPVAKNSVQVKFTTAVDSVATSNFAVSGGSVALAVTDATLDETKTVATLTLSGDMDWAANYELTVKNVMVGGAAQAEKKVSFTSLKQNDLYKSTLVPGLSTLKSDGGTTTTLTFTLKDTNGDVITDHDVEVTFTKTHGNLSSDKVTTQNGVAVNRFTSEYSTSDLYADIRATVTACRTNPELVGVYADTTILLTPNPSTEDINAGAVLTSVDSNTADRVVAYFNKEVNPKDFMTKDADGYYIINKDKAEIKVYSGMVVEDIKTAPSIYNSGNDNFTSAEVVTELKDAKGNVIPNALQILVKEPLKDNTIVGVEFTDKRGTTSTSRTLYFTLTDARQPSVMSVTNVNASTGKTSYRKLTVEYSEAVYLPGQKAGNSAENPANYLLDGVALTNSIWGTTKDPATVTITGRNGINKNGEDKRYEVSLELGKDANGKRVYLTPGKHMLQIYSVGDWASKWDMTGNKINVETLLFEVVEDKTEPTATVEVQSPEQYKVHFDTEIEAEPNKGSIEDMITLEVRNSNGTWSTVPEQKENGSNNGNPLTKISKIDDQNYLVELTQDWTKYYDTEKNQRSYYNDDYRLTIAKKNVYNLDNGLTNSNDIVMNLDDAKMKSEDGVSPTISGDVVQRSNDLYIVTMSEPVKLSDDANKREGTTASQTQERIYGYGNIPTPTAQFVKNDRTKTVNAKITGFDDKEDMKIKVAPSSDLTAGDWTLYISSISDDFGNTTATDSRVITIKDTVKDTGFAIDWAVVGNTINFASANTSGQYVFVKFNQPIAIGTLNSALITSNFAINNQDVTITRIDAHIVGFDAKATAVTDSITIVLDKSVYANSMLNVSTLLQSATGATLTNGGEIPMPYQFATATDNSDDAIYDAVYGNHTTSDPKENVTNVAQLQSALNDHKYRVVRLTGDITSTKEEGKHDVIVIDRPVVLDLNGKNITNVDLSISFTAGGSVEIISKDHTSISTPNIPANIQGNITVNAPNADVIIDSTITQKAGNDTTIAAILPNTFVNKGTLANVIITAGSRSHITNEGAGKVTGLVKINTSSTVELEGKFDNVEVANTATVTVAQNTSAQITNLIVSKAATIDLSQNAMTIGTLTIDAKDIKINLPQSKTDLSGIVTEVKVVDDATFDMVQTDGKKETVNKNTTADKVGTVIDPVVKDDTAKTNYDTALKCVDDLETTVKGVTLGAIKANGLDAVYTGTLKGTYDAKSVDAVSNAAIDAVEAISQGAYSAHYAELKDRINAMANLFTLKTDITTLEVIGSALADGVSAGNSVIRKLSGLSYSDWDKDKLEEEKDADDKVIGLKSKTGVSGKASFTVTYTHNGETYTEKIEITIR